MRKVFNDLSRWMNLLPSPTSHNFLVLLVQCRPSMHLPGASKPIVAVRFCPVVFSLNPNMNQNFDNGSNCMSKQTFSGEFCSFEFAL